MTLPSAPHSPPLRHLSGWRGNLLLLVAGTLVALSLLEAFLRLYNPLGVRVRGDRIVLPRNVRETMTNAANPKLDRVIVFSKNSLGFRGPEPPRDFDRQLSILAVGAARPNACTCPTERAGPSGSAATSPAVSTDCG